MIPAVKQVYDNARNKRELNDLKKEKIQCFNALKILSKVSRERAKHQTKQNEQ